MVLTLHSIKLRKIKHNSEKIIPPSGLKKSVNIPILNEIEKAKSITKKEEKRKLGNIVMNVNGYNFYNCKCGVTIKGPQNFKGDTVTCPRCGEVNVKE